MPGRLQGKVAMITGGNSGIGEATAHRFAQEGAAVVLLARREPEGYAVQQAIRDTGGEACFIPCDVSDRSAVEAAKGAHCPRIEEAAQGDRRGSTRSARSGR